MISSKRQQLAMSAPGEIDSAESDRLKELGNVSFKAKDYEKAVELYTQAVLADPLNMPALSNRAAAYLKLGLAPYAYVDCKAVVGSTDDDNLRNKACVRAAYATLAMNKFDLCQMYLTFLGSAFPEDARAVAQASAKQEAALRERIDGAEVLNFELNSVLLRGWHVPRDHPGGPRHPDQMLSVLNKIHDSLPQRFPVEPRYVPGKGFGLFATRDIAVEEIVFSERAKLCGVIDPTRCHHCMASGASFTCPNVKCSRRFCSARCLEEATSIYHRVLCGKDTSALERKIIEVGTSSTSRGHLITVKLIGAALQERDAQQKRFLLHSPADMDFVRFLTRREDHTEGEDTRIM